MNPTSFVPGQRWFSTAEPELGLGTVMRLAGRSVQIVFTGTGIVRQYAFDSAPLARAEFRVGDTVRIDGAEMLVEAVTLCDGLITYNAAGQPFHEGQLDAQQPVSQADARLISGRLDRSDQFDFRHELLRRRAEAQRHPGWGVLAARIDVIAHQLRVAEVAAERRPPRLLLADEVGLGKTIEAGLIIAQQMAAGRAARVLVLVPESLVHQWFVELRRRFNLDFAIFDEERCESIEMSGDGRNPFEDEQGVIAATRWLAHDRKRAAQVLEAGWDLIVIDEAHHLVWEPEAPSPEYALAQALTARIPAAILLTATPEQLGLGGHFARLRLLDPARYRDLADFEDETARFVGLSATVEKLLDGTPLDVTDTTALHALLGEDGEHLPALLERIAAGDAGATDRLVDTLIDRHGTGRVMIRNRRAAVGGFPQRVRHLHSIETDVHDPTLDGRLLAEFLADANVPGHLEPEHDYSHDPRLDWLVHTLDALAPEKVLLLCRSRAKVQALEDALRTRSGIALARFHEDMNLLQRDRNAAFFAQPDGARLLIASEIGAEGRNFQFAQHVLLWDLPLDPDVLEQRIGRLDRIGQRGDVNIHVAAVAGSAQETLLRWYDEGLDAFTRVCADGRELMRLFSGRLLELVIDYGPGEARDDAFDALLEDTRREHARLSELISRGRDRLLELASRRGADQSLLRDALARDDRFAATDDFSWRLLEQFGVQHESLEQHVVLLDPEYLTLDAFEELKSGPRQATLDRATALSRDDLLYLRDDHPMLRSAGDLLLSSEAGNAACLIDDALPPRTVLLEAVFALECVAQRHLNVSRYLPALPIRSVVDTRMTDRADFQPGARALQRAGERPIDLTRHRKILNTLVPPMLEAARRLAARQAEVATTQAIADAESLLGDEIARLEALARVNPAVHPEEIATLQEERDALRAALPGAHLRLDALRLVASPDFLALRG
ncbi:RNA polymerase-associated protein RapA [Xanthomonadaceae bacterium JHOS43]|nr:RNA polymerase-associated protein RapA [Xanthomonadaceae bacterium JHOS43]MCX7562762.1 RNA polymerase-associated protein RapA [Xanthomonadaceae bacterium XH05]